MGSLDYHKREYLKKAAKIHTTSMRSETLLDVAWSDAQRASLEKSELLLSISGISGEA
ncbi:MULTISPECIES: hypothetical protein [unclassified Bacteroides]|uniref:hypothetical protein n=1 Tax=unclassified Bacteroides TaxID=2646097 RepID=UPI001313FD9C|nr:MULTISPECIES: hypothetical protein [unclassified Bacteroides]